MLVTGLRYVFAATMLLALLTLDWVVILTWFRLAPVGRLIILGLNILAVGMIWAATPRFASANKLSPYVLALFGLAIVIGGMGFRTFIEAH